MSLLLEEIALPIRIARFSNVYLCMSFLSAFLKRINQKHPNPTVPIKTIEKAVILKGGEK